MMTIIGLLDNGHRTEFHGGG